MSSIKNHELVVKND